MNVRDAWWKLWMWVGLLLIDLGARVTQWGRWEEQSGGDRQSAD